MWIIQDHQSRGINLLSNNGCWMGAFFIVRFKESLHPVIKKVLIVWESLHPTIKKSSYLNKEPLHPIIRKVPTSTFNTVHISKKSSYLNNIGIFTSYNKESSFLNIQYCVERSLLLVAKHQLCSKLVLIPPLPHRRPWLCTQWLESYSHMINITC